MKLSYADYEALRAHGEETYPHECCGVLLGNAAPEGNQVRRSSSAPATPAPTAAHNRYNIAPEELVTIQRQARGLGLDIVGFYHSHPDHPAQWSQTDFAEAHWVGCSYVITSVEQGQGEDDQLVPADRHGRGRQAVHRRTDRDRNAGMSMSRSETGERAGMKIHIPTPLRAYTGGQADRQRPRRTVGEALAAVHRRVSRRCASISTPAKASCARSSTST